MPPQVVENRSSTLGESSSSRRRDIQGLRAIAVLMVVCFHAGLPVPGGFVGVDVFFVISGFVITAMLQREWNRTGRIGFAQFYLRRFKRLTPALALMLTVTTLITALVLSPLGTQQTAAKTAIGAILLAANVVIAQTTGGYFDAFADTNPLLNTWSLSIEEQFYLVFPALMAVGWTLARRRGTLRFSPIVLVSGVAMVSFALAMASSTAHTFRGSSWILGFYSPCTRAWEFAIGSLLAMVIGTRAARTRRTGTGFGVLGLGMLTSSLWLIDESTRFPGPFTLLPVIGTLLLLVAGTDQMAFSTRTLSTSPMVKIGDWSYSIYLWHWPLIVFADYLWPKNSLATPLAAALSLAPAVASYRWVEEPIRNLPRMNRARTAVLLTSISMPAIAIAGIVGLMATHFWIPRYASGQMSQYQGDIGHVEFHNYSMSNFFPCTPEEIREHALYWGEFLRCQQSHPTGPVEVALVGDSHVEHLFIGLAEAFPKTNIAYYIHDVLPVRSAGDDMARIIDYVAADSDIETVIITAYWKVRGFPIEDLKVTLQTFRDNGKSVFITDDVPDFSFDPVQCKYRKAPLLTVSQCTEDVTSYRAAYNAYIGNLRSLANSVPGVVLLETNKYFCSADSCSMTNGQNLLYRDTHHLNLNGTKFIAQTLASIRTLARAMATG